VEKRRREDDDRGEGQELRGRKYWIYIGTSTPLSRSPCTGVVVKRGDVPEGELEG